jgi:hypothetical protein
MVVMSREAGTLSRWARMVAILTAVAAVASLAGATAALAAPGSLDSTNAGCTITNANSYATKDSVYLKGSNWEADARFYVKVEQPGGVLLGYDATTAANTIGADKALPCTQLVQVVRKASDNSPGFDESTVSHSPLGNEYQVTVSTDATFTDSSKSDNFKVVAACVMDCGGALPAADLAVTKTAETSLTRTTTWDLDKSVISPSTRNVADGTGAPFDYQVDVTHTSQDSVWTVTGVITITNSADGVATGVNVTDVIDDANATCTVDTSNFEGGVAGHGTATLPYSCTYSTAPGSDAQSNHVTVDWTNVDTTTGSTDFTAPVDWTAAAVNEVDPSVSVSDPYMDPTPQTVTSADPSPTTITYSHTFYGDTSGTCTNHDNTASFTTGGSTPSQSGSDTETVKVCVGASLTAAKTAATTFTRTYAWSIKKTADTPLIEKAGGGTVSAGYHVKVDETGLTDSLWTVSGTITVTNPNDWESVTVDVSDAINAANCTVTGGHVTLAPGESLPRSYSCTFSAAPSATGTNTATVTWDADAAHTPSGSAVGTADYTFADPTTRVNRTINVTDAFNGGAAAALTGGMLTASDDLAHLTGANLAYSRSLTVPATGCVTYPNTATITQTAQSSSASVEVCGPAKTGALTIGYWQNKNGQGIITGQAKTGTCGSATWLRQYAPFQDLGATSTCAQVATYALNVIKAANASGAAMNAMLKAQMLATALDVYFSDAALGGNKIGAPGPIGAVKVDLTMICKMIDNSSAGTGACGGTYRNTTAAFGGAVLPTVSQLLTYAASQSNAGGTVWYGQIKATQELAKDTFDAINNSAIFSP